MKTEKVTFDCPIPDIEAMEKSYGLLVDRFLKPLDAFVREYKVGGVSVSYEIKPNRVPLIVDLHSYICSLYNPAPFTSKEPGYGTLTFRFGFSGEEDKVRLIVVYRERDKYLKEKHPYLPEAIYRNGEIMDWRTFCEYCLRFFQAVALDKVPKDPLEEGQLAKLSVRFRQFTSLMQAEL